MSGSGATDVANPAGSGGGYKSVSINGIGNSGDGGGNGGGGSGGDGSALVTPNMLWRRSQQFMRYLGSLRSYLGTFFTREYAARHLTFFRLHLGCFVIMGLVGAIAIDLIEEDMAFVDAIFMSCSAVSVTGLVVVDTSTLKAGSYVVLWLLIFCGGNILWSTVPVLIRRHFFRKMMNIELQRLEIDKRHRNILLAQEVEYRALGWVIVIAYSLYIFWVAVVTIAMGVYLKRAEVGKQLEQERGINVWAFASTTSLSAINNAGITVTADSLYLFESDYMVQLSLSWLILLGNTAYPIVMHFSISILHRFYGDREPAFAFLIARPRKCFTHLFNRSSTMVLLFIIVISTLFEFFLFAGLCFNQEFLQPFSPRIRLLIAWFQAISVRTAGFQVIDLSSVAPAMQLVYCIMMYLVAYPFAMTLRHSKEMDEALARVQGGTEIEALLESDKTASSEAVAGRGGGGEVIASTTLNTLMPTETPAEGRSGDSFRTSRHGSKRSFRVITGDAETDLMLQTAEITALVRKASGLDCTLEHQHSYSTAGNALPTINGTPEKHNKSGRKMAAPLGADAAPAAGGATEGGGSHQHKDASISSGLSKAPRLPDDRKMGLFRRERRPSANGPFSWSHSQDGAEAARSVDRPATAIKQSTNPVPIISQHKVHLPLAYLDAEVGLSTLEGPGYIRRSRADRLSIRESSRSPLPFRSNKDDGLVSPGVEEQPPDGHVEKASPPLQQIRDDRQDLVDGFRQLVSRDALVFLALLVIAVAENKQLLETEYPENLGIFGILFELCSAFGTVGVSFGYPGTVTSLSARFNPFSKLIVIAVMFAGRHRGLPLNIDSAVYLPTLLSTVVEPAADPNRPATPSLASIPAMFDRDASRH